MASAAATAPRRWPTWSSSTFISIRVRSGAAVSGSHMGQLHGQPIEGGERAVEHLLVVHAAAEAAVRVDEGAGGTELRERAGQGAGRGRGGGGPPLEGAGPPPGSP